ncbi:MAG: hypothetical protein E4H38_02295 [Gemmatimonadales bacterium]|nr:MAG: hypothetical protein E4H38_02295 [Gemmatimonadales bacterium]
MLRSASGHRKIGLGAAPESPRDVVLGSRLEPESPERCDPGFDGGPFGDEVAGVAVNLALVLGPDLAVLEPPPSGETGDQLALFRLEFFEGVQLR